MKGFAYTPKTLFSRWDSIASRSTLSRPPTFVGVLKSHRADTRPFVRQLAYNTYLWNADAHGKNYSVLLDEDRVELTPLYDAVPTRLYPQYDHHLAMPIGKARVPQLVMAKSWRDFADEAGVDAEEVIHTAFEVRDGIAARFEDYILADESNTRAQYDLARYLRHLNKMVKREPLG